MAEHVPSLLGQAITMLKDMVEPGGEYEVSMGHDMQMSIVHFTEVAERALALHNQREQSEKDRIDRENQRFYENGW